MHVTVPLTPEFGFVLDGSLMSVSSFFLVWMEGAGLSGGEDTDSEDSAVTDRTLLLQVSVSGDLTARPRQRLNVGMDESRGRTALTGLPLVALVSRLPDTGASRTPVSCPIVWTSR